MVIKIKKLHPDVVIPKYAKSGDAGLDLIAFSGPYYNEYGVIEFGTGLSVEIPEGYVGLVFPRSSIYKSTGRLSNSVGVIDSGYRGEIKCNFDVAPAAIVSMVEKSRGYEAEPYKKGDRVGQLIIIPYPQIEFEEVEELSETIRGTGGFGSSGN